MKVLMGFAIAALLWGCSDSKVYSDGCGSKPKNWITPYEGRGILSVLLPIEVKDDNAIFLSDRKVSKEELDNTLDLLKDSSPTPVAQVIFDPSVDCRTVLEIRDMIASSMNCGPRECAEGNGRWRYWGDVAPSTQSEPFYLETDEVE